MINQIIMIMFGRPNAQRLGAQTRRRWAPNGGLRARRFEISAKGLLDDVLLVAVVLAAELLECVEEVERNPQR